MTINQKFARFAETMNMSAIARLAGVSRPTLTKYCTTTTTPNATNALKVARALGVSVEWLIDDEQGWPPVYVNRESPSEEQAA